MRLIKHILSGLMLLTVVLASAGIAPQRANTSFAKYGNVMSEYMIGSINKMKNHQFSSGDISNLKDSKNVGMKMQSNHSSKSIGNPTFKEGEKLYTVKCVLNVNDGLYNGWWQTDFYIYNPDFWDQRISARNGVNWDESELTYTCYFQVPAGTYDVATCFIYYEEDCHAKIVHENVTVDSDIEVFFSPDELTETVMVNPILRDGQDVILPLRVYLEEEPWYEDIFTDATASFLKIDYYLFRKDCEGYFSGMYATELQDSKLDDDKRLFKCNKLSDNYHFIFLCIVENIEKEVEISTTDIVGSKIGIMNNYNNDWVKYEFPNYSKTPLYYDLGVGRYKNGIRYGLWINDYPDFVAFFNLQAENSQIYWTMQPIKETINIKVPIYSVSIQGEKTVEGEGPFGPQTYYAEMISLPALYNGSRWEYINQNHSQCIDDSYQRPEEGPLFSYPGVPAYCYFADEITQPIGNSSPVLVLMSKVIEYPGVTYYWFEPQTYIGRYGEVRDCDQWTLHTVINLNSETVFDSDSDDNLYNFWNHNSTDGHEKGLLEATFTNRNVLVDETIPGFNITTIKVDERNEDLCTPTTQMLIFKNSDGVITDRFSTGEEGLIEFSAGDFNWVNDGGYYTCEEADVKVEYAPYGEDTFMPLEVEEIPENYYMPGFGYFYRGSLADVTMPSSNGWYDVRFTLTDKAGNEMVQHISPAFKIEGNVSVAEVAVDGIKVWSVAGKVLAAGSDIEAITLYSADGKLIASTNGNSLSTNGYRGMGIVKVTTSGGITTTHKTVIR